MEQWYSLWTPMAISDDGAMITGWGLGLQHYGGWVLDRDKAFVCLTTGSGKPQTISATFPKAFDHHLAQGATPGRCPQ